MLPAVLVIFGVENLLFMLLRGDMALPLLLTVTVLPTHPAVKVHLKSTKTCIPSAGVVCVSLTCGSGTRKTKNHPN